MEINTKYAFENRRYVIGGVIVLVILVFIVRLFFLQVVDNDYKAWADSNAFLKKTLYPSRGIMYDRNGKLLVYNQPSYEVMVVMREVQPFDTLDFCQILNISKEQFVKRIADIKNRRLNPGYSSYVPQMFMNHLSAQECGVLQEKLYKFPGFYVQNRTIREYAYPNGAHLLGNLGEVSRGEIKKDAYYVPGDNKGKSGIELSYEKILRGEKGVEILLRDARGRIQGHYEDGKHDVAPVSGKNLKLAIKLRDKFFPLRDTAYKSLLDRAKIGGSALPKLSREKLADVINSCLALHKDSALLLVRDEKVSAAHSGDSRDYSILEIDQLLDGLQSKMDERFPGNQFSSGYVDHAITSASWTLPGQREELLDTYIHLLAAEGKSSMAAKLMPGIRFSTSDTGMASAKVSALLVGLQYPIHIGGMIAVEHRRQSKVPDFVGSLDMLFAQFGDSVERLTRLLSVHLEHPVNAMTAVCKRLALPKKAALEAIDMYEMAVGNDEASAHEVFVAMQEIPFILKTKGMPESKLLALQENMARALTINWRDYDYAKEVKW